MNPARFVLRLVGLGVGALVLIPAAAILALIALGVLGVLIGGAIAIGILVLKVMLVVLVLSWLARTAFGWSRPRSRKPILVGPPIAEVRAPLSPRRDKYDIAAERELDEELGL